MMDLTENKDDALGDIVLGDIARDLYFWEIYLHLLMTECAKKLNKNHVNFGLFVVLDNAIGKPP